MRLKTSAPQAHAPNKGGGSVPEKRRRALPAQTRQAEKQVARPQAQKQVARPQAQKQIERPQAEKHVSTRASTAKPPRTDHSLSDIRKYQRSTDLLLSKKPFNRLVREICKDLNLFDNDYRFQADSILAMQEASEAYLVKEFTVCNRFTIHGGRKTLHVKDLELRRDVNEIDGVVADAMRSVAMRK